MLVICLDFPYAELMFVIKCYFSSKTFTIHIKCTFPVSITMFKFFLSSIMPLWFSYFSVAVTKPRPWPQQQEPWEQTAWSKSRRQGGGNWKCLGFGNLRAHHQLPQLNKATPSHSLTEAQVFKHSVQWGPFSRKQPARCGCCLFLSPLTRVHAHV